MSAQRVQRRPRSIITRPANAKLIEPLIAATGFVAVIALAAHGHDARDLIGGASLHGAFETGLMTAAMMTPVAALSVAMVMRRSLPERRLRAVVEHVAGFALVWFTFGFALAFVVGAISGAVTLLIAFAVAAIAATGWQISEKRALIVRRCGRLRTSPPRGLRNDIGVVIAGGDQALGCLRTCSLAMTAMVLAPHPAVMGALWLANLSEWAPGPNPFSRVRRTRPAVVFGLLAAGSLTAAVI